MYKDQFDATEEESVKLGVFCTSPSVDNKVGNFMIMGIIISVGMSFGGLTGYAINPARDIAYCIVENVRFGVFLMGNIKKDKISIEKIKLYDILRKELKNNIFEKSSKFYFSHKSKLLIMKSSICYLFISTEKKFGDLPKVLCKV